MSLKKKIAIFLLIVIAIALNVLIFQLPFQQDKLEVQIAVESNAENTFELFYYSEDEASVGFSQTRSKAQKYDKVGYTEVLCYTIPSDTIRMRLDFGQGESETDIYQINLKAGKKTHTIYVQQFVNYIDQKDISTVNIYMPNGGELHEEDMIGMLVRASGEDPQIVWNVEDWGLQEVATQSAYVWGILYKVIICLLLDLMVIGLIFNAGKIKQFVLDIWQSRKLVFNLAKNDFKTQFAGSYLGIIWAYVQPVVTVLVYWFVFEKGLKAGGVMTKDSVAVPFVLWLIAGIVPWFFFQDAINGGTASLTQYSYLVKKVVFKINILPVVKIVSSLFVHLFFVAFTLILYACYHYYPDLYTLQILYYSLCMMVFVLGIVYASSAIVVFFKDLTQIINIVLQIGIWMTPIMWNIETMDLPPVLITIFKLNPMYYIVSGYRDALINKQWFWQSPQLTIYFWVVSGLLLGVGFMIFRKLKVHFADVL